MILYILLSLILLAVLYVIYLILSLKFPTPTVCSFKETQIPHFECHAKAPQPCRFEKDPEVHKPLYQFSAHPHQEIQILQKTWDGGWTHYAWRQKDAYDLKDYLNTPGFAIKHPGGRIEEGVQ